MTSLMTGENPAPGTDDGRGRDPDNAVFKAAIDNVFKNAAKRGKKHAAGAALRGRRARKRADVARERQQRRT
jgi:hypothetical protein